MWRFLRFLGCPESNTEDLVQNVFVAAARKGIHLEGDRDPGPWLRGTARNLFRSHLRAARRRKPEILMADPAAVEASFARRAEEDGGDAERAALLECLEGLPARSRRALELRYASTDGRGVDGRGAIAAELGLTREGAKSLLRRLRDGLRKCIDSRRGSFE